MNWMRQGLLSLVFYLPSFVIFLIYFLKQAPTIVDLMLAHVGIFTEGIAYAIFNSSKNY